MVSWLFVYTLISIMGLLLIPRSKETFIQVYGLIASLITFAIATIMMLSYKYEYSQFQFVEKIELLYPFNVSFTIGVDGLSIWFIYLSTFLVPICILCSWISINTMKKELCLCFMLTNLFLIGVFSVMDILLFYIFFEAILIPIFLVIGIWGARSQKIEASYYFFFYTLLGSVMMLIGILTIYSWVGTTDYESLLTVQFSKHHQILLWLAFFGSLASKIPMFPFHIWLPQAHVEAPVSGSVILAGILLKMGGYGFLRYSLPMFPYASSYFAPLVLTLSTIAIIYGSITTLRQIDMKRIIAYSSVAHMGVVTLGIFSNNSIAIKGAIYLMIAHGFVSSALFIIVTILYDRHHTRIINYYRGVTVVMPLYSLIFLIFTFANMAVPLSCNFIGEFMVLMGSFMNNKWFTILGSSGVILSAGYSLFLYNRVTMGKFSELMIESRDITRREIMIILPLLIYTIILGIYPEIVLKYLQNVIF